MVTSKEIDVVFGLLYTMRAFNARSALSTKDILSMSSFISRDTPVNALTHLLFNGKVITKVADYEGQPPLWWINCNASYVDPGNPDVNEEMYVDFDVSTDSDEVEKIVSIRSPYWSAGGWSLLKKTLTRHSRSEQKPPRRGYERMTGASQRITGNRMTSVSPKVTITTSSAVPCQTTIVKKCSKIGCRRHHRQHQGGYKGSTKSHNRDTVHTNRSHNRDSTEVAESKHSLKRMYESLHSAGIV